MECVADISGFSDGFKAGCRECAKAIRELKLDQPAESAFRCVGGTTSDDTARIDWLQRVKDVEFKATNQHALAISRVSIFTTATQRITGRNVREVIDDAMRGDERNGE